jgi:hypothetical protein
MAIRREINIDVEVIKTKEIVSASFPIEDSVIAFRKETLEATNLQQHKDIFWFTFLN